jgi:hypothetical protein
MSTVYVAAKLVITLGGARAAGVPIAEAACQRSTCLALNRK